MDEGGESAQMRPLVGISSCLLGEKVRYDGGHQLDRYLRDVLGAYVTFVPICPEVECGLSVPREAMRLVASPGGPRLVTQKTGIDMTDRMTAWARTRLDALEGRPLCGFVFKAKSPSSGLSNVKVYTGGVAEKNGTGLFARLFTERFPLVPAEDDGRLNDASIREHFIERLFVYCRWHDFLRRPSAAGLVAFHAAHKFLFMSHAVAPLAALGRIVAAAGARPIREVCAEYGEAMAGLLAKAATVRKHTNALEHIAGFFSDDLSAGEKAELKNLIDEYRRGLLPRIVPVTLLQHYVRLYRKTYLEDQWYLKPHPHELMLLNHV